jgi:hypothetical protein
MQFDRIVVIFNPHSTGPAPQLAKEFMDALADRLPDVHESYGPQSAPGTRVNWPATPPPSGIR